MRRELLFVLLAVVFAAGLAPGSCMAAIPDTYQDKCYDNTKETACPEPGQPFFGQDAQYQGTQPSYTDRGDGVIVDNVTGLMWQKAHNSRKVYSQATLACKSLILGGYSDWRLPTIKELFSLTDWRGATGGAFFVNNKYFDLEIDEDMDFSNDIYKDTHSPEMMGQTWSSTIYTGKHFDRDMQAAFFMNFLDGHLKNAPTTSRAKGLLYRCVRGHEYGVNSFKDNKNGTVTDGLTGLTWQQADDGKTRNWEGALAYCEDLTLAGKSDWRLPNAKELQSIVDYSRNDPALDLNYFKQKDPDGWFWTSTTHGDLYRMGVYLCFGKCVSVDGVDTHGAGAQRSDPKDKSLVREHSMGGQEDEVRAANYVRCVRGGAKYVKVTDSGSGKTSGGSMEKNRPGQEPSTQGQGMGQGGDRPPGPPQEAFDACSGKTEDDSCSFAPPRGDEVSGTCGYGMEDELICMPEGGPPGGGPPR